MSATDAIADAVQVLIALPRVKTAADDELDRLEWKAVDRLRRSQEPKIIRPTAKLFRDQGTTVAENVRALRLQKANWYVRDRLQGLHARIEKDGGWDASTIIVKDPLIVERIFDRNLWNEETEKRLFPAFAGIMEAGFTTGAMRASLEGVAFATQTPFAQQTLSRTLAQTKGINDTTTRRLTGIVAQWFDDPDATDADLIETIHATFEQWSVGRAGRIGRTGAGSLFEGGQVMAWDEGGVEKKGWLSSRDGNVRTSPFNHQAADGEEVGIKELFVRTGEALRHPLDPNGSPANVVECRCTTRPIIVQ